MDIRVESVRDRKKALQDLQDLEDPAISTDQESLPPVGEATGAKPKPAAYADPDPAQPSQDPSAPPNPETQATASV